MDCNVVINATYDNLDTFAEVNGNWIIHVLSFKMGELFLTN